MSLSTVKSQKSHERALKVLVGGVNSPVRSFRRVGGTPLQMKRGFSDKLEDLDGNVFVDFVMSYGPHLFGHAQPKIIEATTDALKNSSCLGYTTEGEILWAEQVLRRLPWAEKVRAMSTGTEATATAIRLARGITNRELILKFSGHYHGHVDSLLVDGGSGLATLQEASPDSSGLLKSTVSSSKVIEFNDVHALEAAFKAYGHELACVILEPVMGNMGVVAPEKGFLLKVRQACSESGALLIFDEVMTGLRVHRNSCVGLFDVIPDLICLGKVVGGGLPLSALAGKAKFMDHLAPLGPVYQAGTLSGNPVSIAAGRAMMDLIDQVDPYATLEALAGKIEATLREAMSVAGVSASVSRVGSMLSVFFAATAPRNSNEVKQCNNDLFKVFFWSCLEQGYLLPPSPFEAAFISTQHCCDERMGEVFLKAFRDVRRQQ